MGLLARAWAASIVVAGCVEELAIDPSRFPCDTELDCAPGFDCDPVRRTCAAHDAGALAPDAGAPDAAPEDAGALTPDLGLPIAEPRPPRPDRHASQARESWWYAHLTVPEVRAKAAEHAATIASLELETIDPPRLSVVLEPAPSPPVEWHLVEDRDTETWNDPPGPAPGTDYQHLLIEPYDTPAGQRHVVLLAPKRSVGGWWHLGIGSDFDAHARSKGVAPVDLDVYVRDGVVYAWYLGDSRFLRSGHEFRFGLTASEVQALDDDGLELFRFDVAPRPRPTDAPRFGAIVKPKSSPNARRFVSGLRLAEVDELAYHGGYRVLGLGPYATPGGWRYAVHLEDALGQNGAAAAARLRETGGRFAWSLTSSASLAAREGFFEAEAIATPADLRPIVFAALAERLAAGDSLDRRVTRWRAAEPGAADCLRADGEHSLGEALAAARADQPGGLRGLALGLGLELVSSAIRARGLAHTAIDAEVECPGSASSTSVGDLTGLLADLRGARSASTALAWLDDADPLGLDAILRHRLREEADLRSVPAERRDRLLARVIVKSLTMVRPECERPGCRPGISTVLEVEVPTCPGVAHARLAVSTWDGVSAPPTDEVKVAVVALSAEVAVRAVRSWAGCP